MARDRLTRAVEDGLLELPPGRIAAVRPTPGTDLSSLPRDRVIIVSTFRPDADRWQAQGYDVTADLPDADLALVFMPRSKALARATVAEALARAARVAVDGQRTDGIDALWRELRNRLGDLPTVSASHGKLFVLPSGATLPDAPPSAPRPGPGGWHLQPGVFSEGGPDPASVLLARALPPVLPARMADLGAGWGYLARAILSRDGVETLDLVEAERLALDCARLNVPDPRARFHWADARNFRPQTPWDGVVMNPPFHAGRAAEPELGQAFIAAAAAGLAPDGQLWLVANRQLPYEAALSRAFARIDEIGAADGFKLLHARRPRRQR